MNCENIRELLALRLYDELEGSEGARVDAHLTDCGACRKAAAELERGLGRLRVASIPAAAPARPAHLRFRARHVAAARADGLGDFLAFGKARHAGERVVGFESDPHCLHDASAPYRLGQNDSE